MNLRISSIVSKIGSVLLYFGIISFLAYLLFGRLLNLSSLPFVILLVLSLIIGAVEIIYGFVEVK